MQDLSQSGEKNGNDYVIESGITRLELDRNDRTVLPEANLERIGFILAKGYYTRQAVVERMVNRSIKRKLLGLVVSAEKDITEVQSKLFT